MRWLVLVGLLLAEVWLIGSNMAQAYRNGYRPLRFAAWLMVLGLDVAFSGTVFLILEQP